MSVNFNHIAKIIQKTAEQITSFQAKNNEDGAAPLFSSKENTEDELQNVNLINIATFNNNSKSDDELADYLDQLADAIENPSKNSKEIIKNVLLESDLNSSDILSIMASYSGKKDWLTNGIKKQFSGKEEDKLLKIISDACAEMAMSDDAAASGKAKNYIETIDDISKFYKTTDDYSDTNIKVSTMMAGIRG